MSNSALKNSIIISLLLLLLLSSAGAFFMQTTAQAAPGGGAVLPSTVTCSIWVNTGVRYIKVSTTLDGEQTFYSDGTFETFSGTKVSWTATASTGYTMDAASGSLTASSTSSANIIQPTATLKSYTLTVTKNTGVNTLTVSRTSSPNKGAATGTLSNGATIYYGDTLSVSATAATGYTLGSYTSSYTVSRNITVAPTASVNSYTLTVTKNTGVNTLTVSRTSSPKQGAATGALSSGDTIYYGDTLSVSASASTGFTMNSYTSSYTVSSDITVAPTATVNSYTLTVTKNTGVSTLTVSRTSSPNKGAATGALHNGSTIYYGDVLSISATAATGYTMDGHSTTHTVTGNYNTIAPTATINTYTVQFFVNGSVAKTESVTHGSTVGSFTPTVTGYNFAGWFTTAACTTAFDFSSAIIQNTNIYAKTTVKSFTVNATYLPTNAICDLVWKIEWVQGKALSGNASDYITLTVSGDKKSATLTFKNNFAGGEILLTCYSANNPTVHYTCRILCN